jgi:hypothetical protein
LSPKFVDKLNNEINAGLADPKIKARLAEQGIVLPGSPADFGKLIAEETEKWGKVEIGNGVYRRVVWFEEEYGIDWDTVTHACERKAAPTRSLLKRLCTPFYKAPVDRWRPYREVCFSSITGATRSAALPDIPTVGDYVPGYEASGWWGTGVPKNTPVEIVDKLNKEINAALADPKISARLTDLGGAVLMGSPADFGKLIADETEKFYLPPSLRTGPASCAHWR